MGQRFKSFFGISTNNNYTQNDSMSDNNGSLTNITNTNYDNYQFEESKTAIDRDRENNMSITEQMLQHITSPMSTIVGSVQFLAPEILKNIEFKPNSRSAKSKCNSVYGFSADCYSFGCVMWEIITRKEIYKGKSYSDIQKFVLNNNRPMVMASELQGCPDGNFLIRLMNQCWQTDPQLRPNFQQILNMLEDRKEKFMSKDIRDALLKPKLNTHKYKNSTSLTLPKHNNNHKSNRNYNNNSNNNRDLSRSYKHNNGNSK